MSSIGVSMLASIALSQSSRVQSRKSPGGGPPALLTRMSGRGHAASTLARPSGVVMSAAMAVTGTPNCLRISSAVRFSASSPRAQIVRLTPSPASDHAHARPSPLLAAQTIADLPLIPRSIANPLQQRTPRAPWILAVALPLHPHYHHPPPPPP